VPVYNLFPSVWAGPILTSLRAGCKINVIFREFIATPQTIVYMYI